MRSELYPGPVQWLVAFCFTLAVGAGAFACVHTPDGPRFTKAGAAWAAPIASTAAASLCAEYDIPGCGLGVAGALALLTVEDDAGKLVPILCLDVTDEDAGDVGTVRPDGSTDWSADGRFEHGGRQYLCEVSES